MANVQVSYGEMETAAQRLEGGRVDITAALEHLQVLVQDLVASGFVTDSASSAFRESYETFTAGARTTVDGLSGMSGYLGAAVSALRDTDEALARAARG